MAIVFNDPYIAFYSNAKVHVRLTDSNNAENFNDYLFFNHNYLDRIEKKKVQLTHKWEGTYTDEWYPTIIVQDVTSGYQGFRSTVDCRALDSDGNIDYAAQNVLKENEKQRYMTEKGFTEE